MKKQNTKNKWIKIIGCCCYFKDDGLLYITKNAKIIKLNSLNKNNNLCFMVVGLNNKYIKISPDFFSVSYILKRNCRII